MIALGIRLCGTAQGVRSQPHPLDSLIGLVGRLVNSGSPKASGEVVGEGGAIGHRRLSQVGVKGDDCFVSRLERLPESLDLGRLQWGPTVSTAPGGEVGTAGLGPRDDGFLHNCLNKLEQGKDGLCLDLAMLLLGQLPVRVGLLELCHLFGGVNQESFHGRDVNHLRRREGEGGGGGNPW